MLRSAGRVRGGACRALPPPPPVPGPLDLVVLCVDQHSEVMSELEGWSHHAQAGARTTEDSVSDPDLDPVELTEQAELHSRDDQPTPA